MKSERHHYVERREKDYGPRYALFTPEGLRIATFPDTLAGKRRAFQEAANLDRQRRDRGQSFPESDITLRADTSRE